MALLTEHQDLLKSIAYFFVSSELFIYALSMQTYNIFISQYIS